LLDLFVRLGKKRPPLFILLSPFFGKRFVESTTGVAERVFCICQGLSFRSSVKLARVFQRFPQSRSCYFPRPSPDSCCYAGQKGFALFVCSSSFAGESVRKDQLGFL